jgi:hypothetical protein
MGARADKSTVDRALHGYCLLDGGILLLSEISAMDRSVFSWKKAKKAAIATALRGMWL